MALPLKKIDNLPTSNIPLVGGETCIVNDSFDESSGREVTKFTTVGELGAYIILNEAHATVSDKIRVPLDIDATAGDDVVFIIDLHDLINTWGINLPARHKFLKDGVLYKEDPFSTGVLEHGARYIIITLPSVTVDLAGSWHVRIYDAKNRVFETNAWRLTVT
jgi:hypothetical protein